MGSLDDRSGWWQDMATGYCTWLSVSWANLRGQRPLYIEANLDRTTRKSLSMREYSTLIPIAFAYIYQQVPLDEWPRSLQVAPEWLQPLPQLSSSASSFSLIFVAPTKPATIHGLGDSFVSGHPTTRHDPRRRLRPARPSLLVQIKYWSLIKTRPV